ncbi:MAG TPA: hypothetical protein VE623_05580 [Acidimicrobiales bacterium]|jgi:hypothetical protein|nr:hypothetical protein [Acidimicrobiales bacterium]
MSLWTPSGEHPVDRPGRSSSNDTTPPAGGSSTAPPRPGPASLEDLSPEERAQAEELARQVDAARQQLLDAPAGPVVGQQALQFYELAALHLSQPAPKLEDARVAIDAFAAVVNALGSRLGDAETPLRQALNQIQLAFVEVSRSGGKPSSGEGDS